MYSIELFVLLGVVVSVMAFNPLHTKELKAAKKACLVELKIDPTTHFNETNPQFRCYAQCILKKMNVIDGKGDLIIGNIPDNIHQYVIKCAGDTKLTSCETAMTFGLCVKTAVKVHLKTIASECAAETKTVLNLTEYSFKKMLPKLYNDSLACFHRCLLIKIQAINEQNELNLKVAEKYVVVDNFNLEDTVKGCNADNKQDDKCLQAVHRARCIGEKIAKKKMAENS